MPPQMHPLMPDDPEYHAHKDRSNGVLQVYN
ncbi:hypothetical protein FOXG_18043 [Fusarium oxysporum f. sp. lycopersici 4287]|uniref:Uncharacterized protein n=4 Tax=Fusarium oxysporum TaxID=5507 RepID=A0A0J9UA03_FUSO4|nr:hypothetical protein FOXG_18043 [Fusarium oxysporum f. sp. lycopersici 4287]EWZ52238.1 hypothetical protein FOZG_02030 [Fusarium oxysporum Fo47]EXA51525.1 hypothetical protein FOVG_00149 [Fusarium oxysporum f. sp. pisi HDV247]EXK49531.1 hypothetical protein FOMG_02045 [Fusarium oxysporum f. sp. melonis 26406]KNA95814.1 hypothetical protein FOXG_18043 [Fusarium oxysporum f. sp. lycopersici 4287]